MVDAARCCLLVFNVHLPPAVTLLAGLPSLKDTRSSCFRFDTVDGPLSPASCTVVVAEGVRKKLLYRDRNRVIIRVRDVGDEQSDGDAARAGTGEGQTFD